MLVLSLTYQHSDNGHHVGMSSPGLQANGHVSSAGVDNSWMKDQFSYCSNFI